jgi:hypothetical protein
MGKSVAYTLGAHTPGAYTLGAHTPGAYTVGGYTFQAELITQVNIYLNGPGSSVGIATGYGLDGPGIESAASVV